MICSKLATSYHRPTESAFSEMSLNNSLYITSARRIKQFLILNTFSVLFSQTYLLINSISLSSLTLESSIIFQLVPKFLDVLCPFPGSVNKLKHMACYKLQASRITN